MHGKAKVERTEEEKEKKKEEQALKAKKYRTGMALALNKRENKEYDEDALNVLEELLFSNPDIYTLWNFRREILLDFKDTKKRDEMIKVVSGELRLTEGCLRVNPKSYCVWYHRLWLMDNMPETDLNTELLLCTKYLKLDERNFHCWDYRRSIVSRLGVSPSDELKYTTSKIEENFSNYSSWHYRSKLLPLVHPDPMKIRPIDEGTHLAELEMVTAAAYTDPYDQSAWFYQRWLLGRSVAEELGVVAVCVGQHRAIVTYSGPRKPIVHGLGHPSTWHSPAPHILIKELDDEELNEGPKLQVEVEERVLDEVDLEEKNEGYYRWSRKPEFRPQISPALRNILLDQLDSANQLLELEPETKWTLLISTLLMQAIDRKKYKDEMMEKIDELIRVDPYRSDYYRDLRSRWRMEEAMEKSCAEGINLSGLGLTRLYHTEWLLLLESVDLSNNSLTSGCLPALYPLQSLQVLILDSNELKTLEGLPPLGRLEELSVRENRLESAEEVKTGFECQSRLLSVDLRGNPLTTDNMRAIKSAFQTLSIFHDQYI